MTSGFSSFALGGGATQKQRVSYFYDGNLVFFFFFCFVRKKLFSLPIEPVGLTPKEYKSYAKRKGTLFYYVPLVSVAIALYLTG